mmetsp:Transcript_20240/g.68875  ORF Transcript_20240/g.68875 Transcript_20240/m.68875 type:complete len:307 (+) Transcript_20240:289-1209(+)
MPGQRRGRRRVPLRPPARQGAQGPPRAARRRVRRRQAQPVEHGRDAVLERGPAVRVVPRAVRGQGHEGGGGDGGGGGAEQAEALGGRVRLRRVRHARRGRVHAPGLHRSAGRGGGLGGARGGAPCRLAGAGRPHGRRVRRVRRQAQAVGAGADAVAERRGRRVGGLCAGAHGRGRRGGGVALRAPRRDDGGHRRGALLRQQRRGAARRLRTPLHVRLARDGCRDDPPQVRHRPRLGRNLQPPPEHGAVRLRSARLRGACRAGRRAAAASRGEEGSDRPLATRRAAPWRPAAVSSAPPSPSPLCSAG